MKTEIKGPVGIVVVIIVIALVVGAGFWFVNKPKPEGPEALKMKQSMGHAP